MVRYNLAGCTRYRLHALRCPMHSRPSSKKPALWKGEGPFRHADEHNFLGCRHRSHHSLTSFKNASPKQKHQTWTGRIMPPLNKLLNLGSLTSMCHALRTPSHRRRVLSSPMQLSLRIILKQSCRAQHNTTQYNSTQHSKHNTQHLWHSRCSRTPFQRSCTHACSNSSVSRITVFTASSFLPCARRA